VAKLIQAYVEFGPRLTYRPTVRLEELAERLAISTGLKTGEALRVLHELQAALRSFGQRGAPVQMAGIGTFRPNIRSDGQLVFNYRMDRQLRADFDNLLNYKGEVLHRENIGLSPEAYKALWDAAHPEDPLEFLFQRPNAA